MPNQLRSLPVMAGLTAFVLYLCTMGSEANFYGLPLASKLAGWDASPLVGQPVLWLVTLPLRIFPGAWIPFLLKVFSAAIAAVVLGLLARTVQLLPWDRPWDEAKPKLVVLPVVCACALCGLEFSFWMQATSTCTDLLDLLLFVMVVWLVLEYDASKRPVFLYAGAFVLGLGLAQNWVLLLLLPFIVWKLRGQISRGLRRGTFFDPVLARRLVGLFLAGFLVYALLPTANGLMPHSQWSLSESWSHSLRQTKEVYLSLYYQFWRGHRLATLAVGICFLVPTLPLTVRMRDEGTRNKSGADRFQTWLYRGLRLAILLACFWIALDPAQGARQMVYQQLGIHLPMLTLDYLIALGAAFLLGNLVLASQVAPGEPYRRSRSRIPWGKVVPSMAAAALTVIAAALLVRSAPAVVHKNFHPLQQYGDWAVKSLPGVRGVILCDFADQLETLNAALSKRQGGNWLTVDTRALPSVDYRARLERRQPDGWLTDQTRHELTPVETVQLLEQVARTNRMFYLHPSFGSFFERFRLEPVGTIYEMKLRGNELVDRPALSAADLDATDKVWNDVWDHCLEGLIPAEITSRFGKTLAAKLDHYGFSTIPREQDRMMSDWFSISLDAWAVTLQQQGRLPAAQVRFAQAVQLNTNNLSARISLACNTNLQTGTKMGLADVGRLATDLGGADRVEILLLNGGPVDEPTVDYLAGAGMFFTHGLLVQAAEQLERVRVLAPGSLMPEMVLAQIYNQLRMPERSHHLVSLLREQLRNAPTNSALELNLAMMESYSWLLQTNVANARDTLQSLLAEYPDDAQIANRVTAAYLALNDVTNALAVADARLARDPNDFTGLNAKSMILVQTGRASNAIPLLSRIVTLTNAPGARVNLAFARISAGDREAAKRDLDALAQDSAVAPGIADIGYALLADHDHDTNTMIHYLELCISNPAVSPQLSKEASARLKALKNP